MRALNKKANCLFKELNVKQKNPKILGKVINFLYWRK